MSVRRGEHYPYDPALTANEKSMMDEQTRKDDTTAEGQLNDLAAS